MSNINPWKADNLQPFWYLNCPECTFKVKEEKLFQDHAVKKHPLSYTLFEKSTTKEEPVDVIEETMMDDHNSDQGY